MYIIHFYWIHHWNQRNHPNHQTLKNADREGEEDEKIFLSAKQKEGWLVYSERRLSAQVQVDYNLRASIKYVDKNVFHT